MIYPLSIILLVATIGFVIGLIWYSPLLFGRLWMHLSGVTEKDLEATRKSVVISYLISFLIGVLKTYVLAEFILSLASDMFIALQIGFRLWIGFVATTQLSETLWTHRPKFALAGLNTAHQLVVMLVSAYLLYLWL